MTWQDLDGHDLVAERFRRSLQRGRLGNAYLFVGPPGIGKLTFARRLAQTLLCQQQDPPAMQPCRRCDACRQIEAGTHPDVETLGRRPGKRTIEMRDLVGDRELRMRDGLCYRIALKPVSGPRRIGIIDDADYLGTAQANCLLKTLEEPPAGSILILIGSSLQRQLPTIRSRCQVVAFRPLSQALIERMLMARGWSRDDAVDAAEVAEGSMQRALIYGAEDFRQFRQLLGKRLASRPVDTTRLAKEVLAFAEAPKTKTKETHRHRLLDVVQLVLAVLRSRLARQAGGSAPFAAPFRAAVEVATETDPIAWEITAEQIERTLQTIDHIEANAHLHTLVDAWIDESFRLIPAGLSVTA